MTKQDQNEIIIRHIDEELRDTPGVADRVGAAFNNWFQTLVQIATTPQIEEEPLPEEAPV
jgi:hypothetical protein